MKHNKAAGVFSTQFVTALISTTLVLVLLGTIVLFVFTARNLSNYVRENINISILLNDDITQGETQSMRQSLMQQQYVKSLKYISKQQALHEQCVSMGTDPSEFLGYNPFTASFEIKVKSEYANNQSLSKITQQLKSTHKVMDVIYQKELMNSVNKNIRKFSVILLIIAALFTYISFALINNTVRLTIFSRRFIINTMKLVGATKSFIRGPFLGQSVFQGLFSALLAILMLLAGLFIVRREFSQLFEVFSLDLLLVVLGIVVVSGVVICLVSTYFVVGKLVSLPKDDLYY